MYIGSYIHICFYLWSVFRVNQEKFTTDVYSGHKPKLMHLEQCVLAPIHIMKFAFDLNGSSAGLSAATDYTCQY